MRISQADELPRGAGVGGFKHTVAANDVATDTSLASADVDDVGIRFGNCDGPDGGRRVAHLVEDRLPVQAAIGGFPDASGDSAEIISVGLAHNSSDRNHPASAIRPNQSILHSLEGALGFFVVLLGVSSWFAGGRRPLRCRLGLGGLRSFFHSGLLRRYWNGDRTGKKKGEDWGSQDRFLRSHD